MDRSLLDPNGLSKIAGRLKSSMFGSKAVVEIDSIIVTSLFGQRAKKKEKRAHRMQTLSIDCVVDQATRDLIYSSFETNKTEMCFGRPAAYVENAKSMAMVLYRGSSLLKSHGPESKDIIEWCISAYSMVINPDSCVKLSCVRMGAAETLGFAIHAAVDIKKGRLIYELVGLMPRDNRAAHSTLSCTKPHGSQNQSSRVERVLFGPVRFVNHICVSPNAEYVAVSDSSAFYVVTVRDIAAGEELLVDYGKGWFEDEPEGCPCASCKPEEQVKKRKNVDKDPETVEAEKRAAKREKRKRKTERKKLGGNMGSS